MEELSLRDEPDSSVLALLPLVVIEHLEGTRPALDTLDGSLLFIDIAGFSSIASKLQQLQSDGEGSETLTHHLNVFFTKLITVVQRYGGDVIFFSGDAMMVCWCSGTFRECAAACLLCGAELLSATPEYTFSMSDSDLLPCTMRLHVGGSAGRFHGMVVGGRGDPNFGKYKYLLTGFPVELCGLAAAAGGDQELVVTEELLRASELVCRTEPVPCAYKGVDTFYLYVSCENPPPPPLPPVSGSRQITEAVKDLSTLFVFDTVVKAVGGAAALTGSLRTVCTVFIKLTSVKIDSEPAVLMEQVNTAVSILQTQLARYGGILNKVMMDDKGMICLCLFGVPLHSHPNDSSRAVHFAMRSSRKIQRAGIVTSMGISKAPVFCGLTGSPRRHEFTVLGSGVNLAARLMCKAEEFSPESSYVLVDTATATARDVETLSSNGYAIIEGDFITLKGIPHPVRSHHLIKETDREATLVKLGVLDGTADFTYACAVNSPQSAPGSPTLSASGAEPQPQQPQLVNRCATMQLLQMARLAKNDASRKTDVSSTGDASGASGPAAAASPFGKRISLASASSVQSRTSTMGSPLGETADQQLHQSQQSQQPPPSSSVEKPFQAGFGGIMSHGVHGLSVEGGSGSGSVSGSGSAAVGARSLPLDGGGGGGGARGRSKLRGRGSSARRGPGARNRPSCGVGDEEMESLCDETNSLALTTPDTAVTGREGIVADGVALLAAWEEDAGREDETANKRMIMLLGETHVGLSSIVTAVAARATVPAVQMRCSESAETGQYHSLRSVLTQLLLETTMAELTDKLESEQREHMPYLRHVNYYAEIQPPGEELAAVPVARKERAIAALVVAMLKVHYGPKLLMLVEDLQWCDAATAAFLAHIRADPGVFVIAAKTVEGLQAEDAWCGDDGCAISDASSDGSFGEQVPIPLPGKPQHLPLSEHHTLCAAVVVPPLKLGDCAKILAERARCEEVDTRLLSALYRKCDGLPGYLIELYKQLEASGMVAVDSTGRLVSSLEPAELEETLTQVIPAGMEAGVLSVVDRLCPLARKVASLAAVLGRTAPSALLDECLVAEGVTPEEVEQTTAMLVDIGLFLTSDNAATGSTARRHSLFDEHADKAAVAQVAFRKQVARDVIYNSVLTRERKRLHYVACGVLRTWAVDDEDCVYQKTLVDHFIKAGRVADGWADLHFYMLSLLYDGSLGDAVAVLAELITFNRSGGPATRGSGSPSDSIRVSFTDLSPPPDSSLQRFWVLNVVCCLYETGQFIAAEENSQLFDSGEALGRAVGKLQTPPSHAGEAANSVRQGSILQANASEQQTRMISAVITENSVVLAKRHSLSLHSNPGQPSQGILRRNSTSRSTPRASILADSIASIGSVNDNKDNPELGDSTRKSKLAFDNPPPARTSCRRLPRASNGQRRSSNEKKRNAKAPPPPKKSVFASLCGCCAGAGGGSDGDSTAGGHSRGGQNSRKTSEEVQEKRASRWRETLMYSCDSNSTASESDAETYKDIPRASSFGEVTLSVSRPRSIVGSAGTASPAGSPQSSLRGSPKGSQRLSQGSPQASQSISTSQRRGKAIEPVLTGLGIPVISTTGPSPKAQKALSAEAAAHTPPTSPSPRSRVFRSLSSCPPVAPLPDIEIDRQIHMSKLEVAVFRGDPHITAHVNLLRDLCLDPQSQHAFKPVAYAIKILEGVALAQMQDERRSATWVDTRTPPVSLDDMLLSPVSIMALASLDDAVPTLAKMPESLDAMKERYTGWKGFVEDGDDSLNIHPMQGTSPLRVPPPSRLSLITTALVTKAVLHIFRGSPQGSTQGAQALRALACGDFRPRLYATALSSHTAYFYRVGEDAPPVIPPVARDASLRENPGVLRNDVLLWLLWGAVGGGPRTGEFLLQHSGVLVTPCHVAAVVHMLDHALNNAAVPPDLPGKLLNILGLMSAVFPFARSAYHCYAGQIRQGSVADYEMAITLALSRADQQCFGLDAFSFRAAVHLLQLRSTASLPVIGQLIAARQKQRELSQVPVPEVQLAQVQVPQVQLAQVQLETQPDNTEPTPPPEELIAATARQLLQVTQDYIAEKYPELTVLRRLAASDAGDTEGSGGSTAEPGHRPLSPRGRRGPFGHSRRSLASIK
eukprot:Rhum_TRINITY_DN13832_c1_g1::Rhum_TRINITY_DN13832_c1_g1_i2::g.64874::m.64874